MKSMTKNNVELWFARRKRFKKDGVTEEDDIAEMGDDFIGRIEIELFDADTPRTAKNFRTLASGEKGKGKCGKKLHYLHSPIHRVADGKFIQGGDFVKGTGGYGESIYGGDFKDEPKGLKKAIDAPGLVCMANGGKNSNTSQYFITLAPLPDLTGKHVVFGRVVAGMDVVERIEALHKEHGQGEEWQGDAPFVWRCDVCDGK